MNTQHNVLGCFVSYPSLMFDASEEQKVKATNQGDLFRTYIWGKSGIANKLKSLDSNNYGNDLELALFQFYVNPIEFELQHLKEIESYRKKEKAIGIPVIINDENFFSKSEEDRRKFLKESLLQKLDVLAEVVKKKKLDTNIVLLKSDLSEVLKDY